MYEMILANYFRLSTGQIILEGYIKPNLNQPITACMADLFVNDLKLCSINIVGENRLTGENKKISQEFRSVRTNNDIYALLQFFSDQKIKLVFDIKSSQ